MRKKLITALFIILSVVSLSAEKIGGVGIIYENDFRKVGVSEDNIVKAKKVIFEANKRNQLLILERKQLELEINKYMLEDPNKNWDKISAVFDKIGKVEAELMKNKFKSQIEIKQFISEQQYISARAEAVKRIEAQAKNKNKNINKN